MIGYVLFSSIDRSKYCECLIFSFAKVLTVVESPESGYSFSYLLNFLSKNLTGGGFFSFEYAFAGLRIAFFLTWTFLTETFTSVFGLFIECIRGSRGDLWLPFFHVDLEHLDFIR